MTTDVAVPEDHAEVVPVGARTSELVLWAYEARQASLIAASLAKTTFVPASLRGKPLDIAAAILAGQELGLKPMATLRSIDVIQGTPALRAHAMRGLVQSRGHTVEVVESDDGHCVVRGRRHQTDEWQTVEWTLDRAKKMGLLDKDQWKKQPRTMLVARATSEMCRLVASDVLYAMPYAAEELYGEPAQVTQGGHEVRMPTRVTTAELLGEVPAADESNDVWPDAAQPPDAEVVDGA